MTLNAELDQWQPAGYAVRIEYSRAVMEQLRIAVTGGFNRISHGGVEIGGVLFGFRDQDTIRILAHRELPCQHAFGPSFTLSDEDRNALTELLRAPDSDVELRSMQPVGWYHSHNRSDIQLTDQDLELYDQYFPEKWQIALVLRPHRFDPVRAGFFFREPDGSVKADATRQEFFLLPVSGKVEGASLPEEPSRPVTPEAAATEPGYTLQASQVSSVTHSAGGRASAGRRVRWGWVAAASFALLAAGQFGLEKSARKDVSLRVVDVGSQHLRINWDHGAPAIQRSADGEMEIQDGAVKIRGPLSRELLLTGNVTYFRTSEQVLVRLILRRADGSTVTEVASFAGAPIVSAAVPGLAPTVPATPLAQPESAHQSQAPEPSPLLEQRADRTAQLPARTPITAPAQMAREVESPAPAHLRRWVAPVPAVFPTTAELPSPPAVAESFSAPIASIIPRTPVGVAPKPPDQGPTSGKLIWTGKLTRGGTIQILGGHASLGRVAGTLPGGPVRIRVFPTELTQNGLRVFTGDALSVGVPEAPGAQNGWMQTTWVLDAKKAGDLRIIELPSQDNGWNRLTVRAERGDHTVIVLNWDRLSGSEKTAVTNNPKQ